MDGNWDQAQLRLQLGNSKSMQHRTSHRWGGGRRPAWFYLSIVALIVLGVAIRIAAISVAPQRSYLADHIDALAWGAQAYRNGALSSYDVGNHQPLFVYDAKHPRDTSLYFSAHEFNYPPLSSYLFQFQYWLWNKIETRSVPIPSDRDTAARLAKVGVDRKYRWMQAWTWNAQFASAAPTIPFDILLAFSVLWLVRLARSDNSSRGWEIFAFAAVMLSPAVFLNSAFWNQYEAWVSGPMMLCLVMLLRRRFAAAGALCGVSLMLKTSALLFMPVVVYSLVLYSIAQSRKPAEILRQIASFGLALCAVAALSAMPFMIHDYQGRKGDWPSRWLRKSYFGTLNSDVYQRTTLGAFNIWWLDYLHQRGSAQGGELDRIAADPSAKLWGLEKDTIGRALLIVALGAATCLCGIRPKKPTFAVVAFGALVLMAVFVLPTRVHERYIYFCIPMLIAAAAIDQRWMWPFVAVMTVGSFEMTSYSWTSPAALREATGLPRVGSFILSCTCIGAFVASYALVAIGRIDPPLVPPHESNELIPDGTPRNLEPVTSKESSGA